MGAPDVSSFLKFGHNWTNFHYITVAIYVYRWSFWFSRSIGWYLYVVFDRPFNNSPGFLRSNDPLSALLGLILHKNGGGNEWSIKIFNCSPNFTFARFARKILTSARLLVQPKFFRLLTCSLSCQYCSTFCGSFFGLK